MSTSWMRGGRAVLVVVIAASLAGVAFHQVWHLTRTGPGISHDSVDYLAAADSIYSGHLAGIPYPSYNEPPPATVTSTRPVEMTNFPPLFPALVAATRALTGEGATAAARLLNALALSLTVALVGWLVWRATGGALWTAAAMAAIVFQPDMVMAASMVWSEPSTILLMVGAMLALGECGDRRERRLLVGAGLLAGGAILDRFLAIALVPVGLAVAFMARRRRGVVIDWLSFGAAALAPIALWTLLRDGGSGNRALVWHAQPLRVLGATAQTAYDWLSPIGAARIPTLVLGLALVAAAITTAVRSRRAPPITVVSGLTVAFGLAALFLAGSLFDLTLEQELASSGLNHRILLPLYPAAVVFVACVADAGLRRLPARAAVIAWPLVGALCIASLLDAAHQESVIPTRFGYATASWRGSPTLALVRRLPLHDLVVTNVPDFVWLETGRVTTAVPRLYFSQTGERNASFGAEIGQIRRAVAKGMPGWLALWTDSGRPYLPTVTDLTHLLRIRSVASTPDGSIFRILPAG